MTDPQPPRPPQPCHQSSLPSPCLFIPAPLPSLLFPDTPITPPPAHQSPPAMSLPPLVLIPILFCESLNVYFLSASSSILTGPLLGGFAPLSRYILFAHLSAASITDEIEISCANAHTEGARVRGPHSARYHTRRRTKRRRAARRGV